MARRAMALVGCLLVVLVLSSLTCGASAASLAVRRTPDPPKFGQTGNRPTSTPTSGASLLVPPPAPGAPAVPKLGQNGYRPSSTPTSGASLLVPSPVPGAPAVPKLGRPRTFPPITRLVTLTPNKFLYKRNYEIACSENGGRPCLVKCPSNCPNKCVASCSYCMTFCMCDMFPGTSCGDPRFIGGDGNTFYFHGEKDQNFCIVSDANLHINAHFIGNHNPDLKRDFTWVQALGVSFGDHRLYIGAHKAVDWEEEEDHIQITFDGEPVNVDTVKYTRWMPKALPGLSVTRMDTVNTVIVDLVGVFGISANAVPISDEDNRIHKYGRNKSDCLVHLDLGFQFHNLTKDVDGVLGQTYSRNYVNKLDITAKMPIMGGASKYLSSGLFSTDCAVSKFHRSGSDSVVVTTFNS